MKRVVSLLSTICFVGLTLSAQNPPITPAWAFRHIAWEDSINTSQGAISLVDGYLKRDIPVGGVIIDSPWSDSYNDFNWDRERYPDGEDMIRYFKDNNVKVIMWLTGAINTESKDTRVQKSVTYDEAVSKNYGINNSQQGKWWKGKGIHIDFTKKKAKEWWFKQLDKVFMEGVYGWKVDQGEFWFGDTIHTSVGTLTNEEFRHYYYDAMYDYTLSRNKQGVIIARPYSHQGGYFASVGKMNLGWSGDFSGDWRGLKLQIDNIYTSAQKGYGAPACEVAGFFMKRSNKEQFVRYAQFGAMTAGMINGGENGAFSNHLPWYHGKDVEDIYRFCVVFHEQLIPYLFSTVVEAHLKGGSLLKNTSLTEESHQLGNDIFTKAITSTESRVSFKLPERADWVDFWSGEVRKGGTAVTQTYPLDRFPLFFKQGSIVPMHIDGSLTGIGDATMRGKETFLIHSDSTESSLVYHAPRNEGIEYDDIHIVYNGKTKKLKVSGKKEKEFVFIIRNVDSIHQVSGASSWHYDSSTRELRVVAKGKDLIIRMA